MSSRVRSIITNGSSGVPVDIECHLSNSLPGIVIVGFASKSVDEARERLRGAFANSRLELPRKRITINLAPADVPKDGSSFDLAIAAAILAIGRQISYDFTDQVALLGELSLDGSVRPVRGIIGKILTGRANGICTFFIPTGNLQQAQLVPGVTLVPVTSLSELYHHLNGSSHLPSLETGDGIFTGQVTPLPSSQQAPLTDQLTISDIVGQAQAKRALEIAAAGGHNVFLNGPPGTGKSMLAKALPTLLPDLSHEEMLEVTHLHSLAGHAFDRIITTRPFRAPHHSASHIAVIGGGNSLRPGEISLAHRGILFFDELPEFDRLTLEALRQPLEDRVISIARARDTAEYPANFIMVATANPCPCGYYGTGRECRCLPSQVQRYRLKLSGPILDRIDLYCNVNDVEHDKLLHAAAPPSDHLAAKRRVVKARQLQAARYKSTQKLNATMTNADIKRLSAVTTGAKNLLDVAARRLDLSARAYMRSIKVARTIADLESSPTITEAHISEALQYRSQQQSSL